MARWLRRIGLGFLALVLLAALLIVGGLYWLRGSLPQTEGEIRLDGLRAPVEILRDADGVPTIRAGSLEDAAFALGFLHAGDRLFQMEFMRRLAAGRLSEIMGERTLETDKLMRLLGFARRAAADFERLPTSLQARLQAYADGVNAFMASHKGPWPPEFYFLRHEPEPWQPTDSLLWGWLMAWQLSGNWQDELLRFRLAQILTPRQLESLWPGTPPMIVTGAVDSGAARRWAAGDAPFMAADAGASNSWAVAGGRSDSGAPLLANDPHLGLNLPIQWYLARIETPERLLVGATAPGLPLMILGHNGHVAWSFTTTNGDLQDLFIEKFADETQQLYATPDGPLPFVTHQEAIRVRGEATVLFTARETRHGPVVSDLDGPASQLAAPGHLLALGWSCFAGGLRPMLALEAMNGATSAAAFQEATRDFTCPMQNIVFADRERIGFIAAGLLPLRRASMAASQMPVPGWSGDYDWLGSLPFAQLPQRLDPIDGLIVTANNDIRPPGYAPFLAARFDAPYRAQRIAEWLAARPQLALDDMSALQMDNRNLAAAALLPSLLDRLAATGDAATDAERAARVLLATWDFESDRASAAALIFNSWLAEINQALLADELGEDYNHFGWWNADGLKRLLIDAPAPAWCDDVGTAESQEDCGAMLRAAFDRTVAALVEAHGGDPNAWRWGDAHRAPFAHSLFRQIPILGDWLAVPVETDGDNYTVNRGTAPPHGPPHVAPGFFPHRHGAGLRTAFDLADLDGARFIIAGGQSGNPFSPHYADQIERWRAGGFLTILPEAAGDRLLLTPTP